MKTPVCLLAGAAGLFFASALLTAATVDERVIGTVAESNTPLGYAPYTASERGAHLAVIVRKGSRLVVNVDGVEGPRFDELLMLDWAWLSQRRHATQGTPATPVVFSRDGSRFAYLARQGQEWIVVADHLEMLRLPAIPRSGANLALEFTGESGKHLLFTRSSVDGAELWVDGQKWPGAFPSPTGPAAPLVSPDGEHVACVMMSGGRSRLMLDGKDAGYAPAAESLQFTPDSQHLMSIAHTPQGDVLLRDGKALGRAREIAGLFLAPTGNRFIAVISHQNPDRSLGGYVLLVDGKPVPATHSPTLITDVIFSPDGKRYAAICGQPGAQFVVLDGKKGQEYQSVQAAPFASSRPWIEGGATFTFTPDSSKLVYIADAAGRSFVVVNEEESEGLTGATFRVSRDGRRIAYWERGNVQPARLFVDGKVVARAKRGFTQFAFSADGSRFVYENEEGTHVDGQSLGVNCTLGNDLYEYIFSPDGKHLAVTGTRPSDLKRGIFFDRELVCDAPMCRFLAFTPDNRHVYWLVSELVSSGKQEWVTYLDGNAVVRCDAFTAFDKVYNFPLAGRVSVPPSGWDMTPEGILTFVGIVGDTIKRFSITPSADSSLASRREATTAVASR